MNIGLIKRGIYIAKVEGVLSFFKKTVVYLFAKTVAFIADMLYETNSTEYWDFRMKWDWNFVGGGFQTQVLATSLFANVDYKNMQNVNTVLDYGCATGDSAIVLKVFLPNLKKIFLYDVSNAGVTKAVTKFQRFLPVEKWDKNTKADLVYCSNVIEHVDDPALLVQNLIQASNKYVVIQCPWDELDQHGQKLTPQNKVGEHIWTVDEDFFNKHIASQKNIKWHMTKGIVPMAWEGGIQAYYLGEIQK